MTDIDICANDLIITIKESDTYKRYIYLKEMMLEDTEIMNLIEKVKTLQKELIKSKTKGLDYKEIDDNINKTLSELNNIPTYVEYDYVQSELNDLLQNVKNTIESCINDITK